jgi:preprotein translocase subunit SecB
LSPKVFSGTWQPSVKVDLNNRVNKLEDNVVEVVLTLTVTAQLEEETAFLVEVQQAGLFLIKGLTEEQFALAVNVNAPTTLFPYVREAIDSLVTRGGFPVVGLQPVNFEAMYRQKMAQPTSETN